MIDKHNIYFYSELIKKLCDSKLFREAILITELIEEDWPVYKYESVGQLTQSGYKLNIHELDKSKSKRSRALANISICLMNSNLFSDSIVCH